ncbi:MAG: hypothetical protein WC326_06245 [Candidatus Delongbacteria bacterium]
MSAFSLPRLALGWGAGLVCLGVAQGAGLGERLYALPAGLPTLLPSTAAPALPVGPASFEFSLRQEAGDHDGLDLLQALLLPGFDQAQHGQWLKGALFLVVETGVLLGADALNRRGDELDGQFKDFANEHWSYERFVTYRQHPGEFAGGGDAENEGWLDRNLSEEDWLGVDTQAELDALFGDAAGNDEFVPGGGQGSHGLPGHYVDGYSVGDADSWEHFLVSRTQQFYEMIGKYAQFQRGWDGFGSGSDWELASDLLVARDSWGVHKFCAQTEHYMAMRTESNDKLIAADRLMGVLLANHVASFLDVLIQLKKSEGPARLQVRAAPLQTATGPASGLAFSWSF